MERRTFLKTAAYAGIGVMASPVWAAAPLDVRRYHVCLSRPVCEANPGLLSVVREAGVTDVWQGAFFYGHWYDTPENLRKGRAQVEAAGLRWHPLNVPLGHPGDSLGETGAATTPLAPPKHWHMAVRSDGGTHCGTSLHPPATEENVEAVKQIAALNPDIIFLDDDFRLAEGPGKMGGCFCDTHRKRFLKETGFSDADWAALLNDVKQRNLSSVLRAWVEFTCDELTGCFRAQQAAAPNVRLGNMVMYLGAEKAGIRLKDYSEAPLRVGEMMFGDDSFGRTKGKTDELFSVLFHRRYVRPENAFSESTAFPSDALSAENMAAKLVTSTIADVHNTMYMSGLTPFPITHWDTLVPAMKKQAKHHAILAGHKPCGPFKHYWGDAERYVGDDKPFSLFLATGMPFEVTDTLSREGFTFLSNFDARDVAEGKLKSVDGQLVTRKNARKTPEGAVSIDEEPAALFRVKEKAIEQGYTGPYVKEKAPVVCAWYPTAGAVLLWNLMPQKKTVHLCVGEKKLPVALNALDTELIQMSELRKES